MVSFFKSAPKSTHIKLVLLGTFTEKVYIRQNIDLLKKSIWKWWHLIAQNRKQPLKPTSNVSEDCCSVDSEWIERHCCVHGENKQNLKASPPPNKKKNMLNSSLWTTKGKNDSVHFQDKLLVFSKKVLLLIFIKVLMSTTNLTVNNYLGLCCLYMAIAICTQIMFVFGAM